MYSHILIATDGSELAQTALEHGLRLAKQVGAQVTVVTVTEPFTNVMTGELAVAFPVEEYDRIAAANAKAIFAKVREAAANAGVACETEHVAGRFAAAAIVDTARDMGCDLIVMASHGRGALKRLLLGSQALDVLTKSTVPVLIVR